MTCTPDSHVVLRAPCGTFEYCECNAIRTAKVDPFSYTETKEAIEGKLKEGLYRGESLLSMFEAVVDLFPLDPGFVPHFERVDREQRDFYKKDWPNFHCCARCSVVTEKDKMVCSDCAQGKRPWADLGASK